MFLRINVISPGRAEVRLGTQPVEIIPQKETESKSPSEEIDTDHGILSEDESIKHDLTPSLIDQKDIFNQVIDDLEVNDPNDSFKVTDDPFQEKQKLTKDEQSAIEVDFRRNFIIIC